MAYRPKHDESEEDLFRLQNEMAAGRLASAGIHLVKRKVDDKDTVAGLDDFTKKPRRAANEKLDVETLMDDQDRHVTVVLSKIQERQPQLFSCPGPKLGPFAGPSGSPRVVRLETAEKGPPRDRRSLFARQMDRLQVTGTAVRSEPAAPAKCPAGVPTEPSRLVSGRGLSRVTGDLEREKIHQENLQRLAGVSSSELEAERERLLRDLDPSLVAFLMRPKKGEESKSVDFGFKTTANQSKSPRCRSAKDVEREKLSWIQEVKVPESRAGQTQARFDFNGDVVPVDADISFQEGLHHHGDEADRAGYTAAELFTLSRSANLRQRQLALRTLGRCCAAAREGRHMAALEAPLLPALAHAGLPFLLRWALDDTSEAAALTALSALAALVCAPTREQSAAELAFHFDAQPRWSGRRPGAEAAPVTKEETDLQVMQKDMILGLLRTDLLQRLAFLIEKMAPRWRREPTEDAAAIADLLRLLTALAQHSRGAAHKVATHSRLLRALIPLCHDAAAPGGERPAVEVLQERRRLALGLQRTLCLSSASICRSHCHEFKLVPIVFDILSSKEISDVLQIECLRVLTVLLNHSVEVPSICSQASVLEASLRKTCQQTHPHDPGAQTLLTAWMTLVTACMTSLRALPNGQLLAGLASDAEELCSKVTEHFRDSFFQLRHQTELLTSCLHCMATMLELHEEHNAGVQLIWSRTLAEKWHGLISSTLRSSSFQVLIRDLRTLSWILVSNIKGEFDQLLPPSLLDSGFVIYQRLTDGSIFTHAPSEKASWPAAVLGAFCRLMAIRSWSVKDWAAGFLSNSDLLFYLRAVVSTKMSQPLTASPLFFSEVHVLADILRLVIRASFEKSNLDLQLFHCVAVYLIEHLHPNQESIARTLFTRVIFGPQFTDLTDPSWLVEQLGLKETSSDADAAPSALLSDLKENMVASGSSYVALLAPSSPLLDDIPLARLVPFDWTYQPILKLYNHQRQSDAEENDPNDPSHRRNLLQCLRCVAFLELVSRRQRLSLPLGLGPSDKFVRLFCFFLCCGDLFLEPLPAAYLSWLLKFLAEPCASRSPTEFETAARSLFASFHDLYTAVLKEYFAVSYGSPVFTNFVLIPTMVCFPTKYRRALWNENSESLRMMRIDISQCSFDVKALLDDDPADLELLRLQTQALFAGVVDRRTPLLFLIALHAVNRALFAHEALDSSRRRFQCLVARSVGTVLAEDLFFYKDFSVSSGMSFYPKGQLPLIRQQYLDSLLHSN